MAVIVLPGLDFNREYRIIDSNNEINFPLFLAVEIVEIETIRTKFLGNGILIDASIIDCVISSEDSRLNAAGILGGKKAHII